MWQFGVLFLSLRAFIKRSVLVNVVVAEGGEEDAQGTEGVSRSAGKRCAACPGGRWKPHRQISCESVPELLVLFRWECQLREQYRCSTVCIEMLVSLFQPQVSQLCQQFMTERRMWLMKCCREIHTLYFDSFSPAGIQELSCTVWNEEETNWAAAAACEPRLQTVCGPGSGQTGLGACLCQGECGVRPKETQLVFAYLVTAN